MGAAASLSSGCGSGPSYRRPNILFVMTDDHGQAGHAELTEDLTKQLRDLQASYHENG